MKILGKTVKKAAVNMTRAFFAKVRFLLALSMVRLIVKAKINSMATRISEYNTFIVNIIPQNLDFFK